MIERVKATGSPVLRAAPTVVLLLVGLPPVVDGIVNQEVDWRFAVGVVLLFLVAVQVLTREWRHWVRTGTRPPRTPDSRFTEPGSHRVLLEPADQRPVRVIAAVRRTTGRDLRSAVALVESGGGVATGLSAESAEAVHAELVAAGATAEVVGPGASH